MIEGFGMITGDLLSSVHGLLPMLAAVGVAGCTLLVVVAVGPRAVTGWRQRAYDRAASAETVRVELIANRIDMLEQRMAVALVRGLHPRQRRGLDRVRVGWPSCELRVVWRDGGLSWQFEAPRQLAAEFALTYRGLHLVLDERSVERADPPAVASAVGRLAQVDTLPLRAVELPEDGVLHRLAGALQAGAPGGAEVRLRLLIRPIPPAKWRGTIDPSSDGSSSIGSLIGHAIVDGLLFRATTAEAPTPTPVTPLERDARTRKRAGGVGFDVGLFVEVAGTTFEEAKALLWRLTDATDPLGDATQQIRWDVSRGAAGAPPRMRLADWELAQLWYLPDASFDRDETTRRRPLAGGLPASLPVGSGILVAENEGRPLGIPLDALPRHLAVIGSTGSGKSTLLLHLVLGLLDTEWGATVIDPHGDLVNDILARIPARHAERVRVLRLADRAHPRAFNFLERGDSVEAQLVTSEFVELFADLWPRFCGPKMQHFLRHALLTLLSNPEPQTVLELVRVMSDEAFRRPYVEAVTDQILRDFWRTQWPGHGSMERDSSVMAVLNKLGAFVAYDSIRLVVGQGVSTLRPRTVMDRGDLLLVDLSRVGGDNASLFGAMLIARYDIDALGRQGTVRESRRPHLLVVDEAPRFATRALGRINAEGRKFGLALALATQTLNGLGEPLRETLIANAGTLALLSPGIDDVRGLVPLFAPLTSGDLLGLRRYELVLKTASPRGRSEIYGGVVMPPGQAGAAALSIIAASDQRDARPRAMVEAEVEKRIAPLPPPSPEPAPPPPGRKPGRGAKPPSGR